MLTTMIDTAAGWPLPVVLAVAAALLVAESGTLVGVVLPGTTLLVALGLWTHAVPGSLTPAVLTAAASTVVGAHLGYHRGRRSTASTRGRIDAARGWLGGRGPAATVALVGVGHWAAAARPVVPRLAGSARVPYRLVGPAVALSGTAWAATLVLLGHAAGPLVLTHAGWAPIAAVVLLVGVLVVRSRWTAAPAEDPHPRPVGADSPFGGTLPA